MLVLRDILMFLFAYLGIKRAGCICKSNPDKIFYDPIELLTIFHAYKGFILDLYSKGHLTEDAYGKKFFITCNPKTLEWVENDDHNLHESPETKTQTI